jgi:capsular polysaccharide biosynthesis protein
MTAGDVYRALWRHKFFIAVLTAALVGATWYATSRQARTYEASTLVRVQERGPNAGDAQGALQAAQSLAQTYAKIIGSGALKGEIETLVARCSRQKGAGSNSSRTGRAGSLPSADAALCKPLHRAGSGAVPRKLSQTKLSADPAQDLPLLTITARGPNPANATFVAAVAPIALKRFIRRTGPSSEQIVTVKAETSSSAVSRHLVLNVAVALMLGLIFNGALALLFELFRDRLPEPEELGEAVGYPVLATIPNLRFHRTAPSTGTGDSAEAIEQSLDGETGRRVTGPRFGGEP